MLREAKKVAGFMMVLEAVGMTLVILRVVMLLVILKDQVTGAIVTIVLVGVHDRDSGNSKNNIGHSFMMVWVMRWAFQAMRIMMMTVVTGGNFLGSGGNDCIVNDGDDKV